MFQKTSKELNHCEGYAYTLSPEDLKENESGWTITGEVHEDYLEWVNAFEATHPVLGRVWGDYEDVIYADSQEAFEHFYKNHPPTEWDYEDI